MTIFNRFWVDLEIRFQSRSMSDPTLSDINFKNKMTCVWTTLKWNDRNGNFYFRFAEIYKFLADLGGIPPAQVELALQYLEAEA